MSESNSTADQVTSDLERKRSKGIWITVASILCVITLFMSMFIHKITSPRILSHEELLVNRAIMFDTTRIIEPFELLDQNGEAFTLGKLKGKWSLIYFGFTHCPDICPTSMSQLSKVMSSLNEDIAEQTQVILVSLDPARDTPEQMKNYLEYFNPEFIGVTGEFLEILSFTRNVNVAFNKVVLKDDYTIDHTGHLVLVNPNGHYHGFFKPPFELATLKLTFTSIVTQF